MPTVGVSSEVAGCACIANLCNKSPILFAIEAEILVSRDSSFSSIWETLLPIVAKLWAARLNPLIGLQLGCAPILRGVPEVTLIVRGVNQLIVPLPRV